MPKEKMLEVQNLKKYFNVGKNQTLKAVDGVSFHINKGETLGLVGESGCGKTTTGRTITRLYEPTGGKVLLHGKDTENLGRKKSLAFTKEAQMIFQDPYSSLNPRMTVEEIVGEGIDIHHLYAGKDRTDRIYSLLETVGLNKEHATRFPHEFSGGQRQRIGIARALAIEPKFIVCDEPISALDVSIQAQIVNLLIQLQDKMGLTYLFIAHDLSMVKHISDHVAVMYLGKIVEMAPSKCLNETPMHPYTKALLSAIPIPDPRKEREKRRILLTGDVPSPINPPDECKFKQRCSYSSECDLTNPPLIEVEKDHYVACHLVK